MENLASKENAVCCLCGKTLALPSALVVALYANIDRQTVARICTRMRTA